MADTVSVTQAVLLRAFKLVDGIAGEINGVPNEPTDDMADDIAMDLADALGVPFDAHWPEAAAEALASTQPAPAFPREEVGTLIHAVASLRAAISLLEGGGKKAAPSDKMFAQMLKDYHAAADKAAALLQGRQP